jgi:hypothetical protein
MLMEKGTLARLSGIVLARTWPSYQRERERLLFHEVLIIPQFFDARAP